MEGSCVLLWKTLVLVCGQVDKSLMTAEWMWMEAMWWEEGRKNFGSTLGGNIFACLPTTLSPKAAGCSRVTGNVTLFEDSFFFLSFCGSVRHCCSLTRLCEFHRYPLGLWLPRASSSTITITITPSAVEVKQSRDIASHVTRRMPGTLPSR